MAFSKIKSLCCLFVIVLCSAIVYLTYMRFFEQEDILEVNLTNICRIQKNTIFIFDFNDKNITVKDPLSMVNRMYILKKYFKKNFFIECKNKKRVFVFKSGAILKSDSDSIDVEKNSQKLHGYMGVYTKNNCYYVDKKGNFFGNEDSRFMDGSPRDIRKYCK